MASKTYYIYEIPGVKIGCTDNVKRRVETVQGYTNYTILEQHTDVMEASRREIELQKKYGYPVDKAPYYKSVSNPTTEGSIKGGKLQGKKNKESGHLARIWTFETRSKGGKISGKINGKANRKLTFEQAEQIREKFQKMDGGKLVRYDTLASEYNVSPSAIRFIIQNKSYTEK